MKVSWSRYLALALAAASFGLAQPTFAQPCPQTTGPDVIVGHVGGGQSDGVADYAPVGGIDAFAVGTYSCNIGNVWLNWFSNTNQHPVIPQNLYRLKTVDGSARFEQIGMSWCKHGFFALSHNLCCNNCQPTNGQHLGVGCADPYTPTRNGEQAFVSGGLGPRYQINAHNGAFTYPYAHKDNVAGTGNNSIARRLQVALTDVNPAVNVGALYYFETQYVSPDDAAHGNQDNNVSYRRGTISGTAVDTTASMSAFTTVQKLPAITAWKVADPTVVETIIDTPEVTGSGPAFDTTGRAYLSAKATDLGGGMWHYEYALYNQNSDRSFDGISIPVSDGTSVTNIGFHDVSYHSADGFNSIPTAPVTFDGTDWPGVFSAGAVAWNMVPATPLGNSNAIRWATMYNFRFDSDQPPVAGEATISMFKDVAGLPASITVATIVPTPIADCPADIDGTGAVDVDDLLAVITSWGACGDPKNCPADIDESGAVDVDDLLAVITSWGACP